MSIKPYLQLVRLPNLFTAAADVLAGWLLAEGTLRSSWQWMPLLGASVAIYAGGVVLNDVFDFATDLVERPGRPLPSGRVSKRLATILGVSLLLVGLVLALVSGARFGGAVSGALIWCVLAYDLVLKRSAFGPEVMGTCRGLNLLLGMSASARFEVPSTWLVAGSYGLFVTGVTWISRSEAGNGPRRNIALGGALQCVALLGWLLTARFGNLGVLPMYRTHDEEVWLETRLLLFGPRLVPGLMILLTIAVIVGWRTLAAMRSPTPEIVQRAVKIGIFSLIWLHVGLLLAVEGAGPALIVGWLWFPAVLAGRWIYST
jgi:4-hydroxybenzoate polyprenyltransferase